MEKIREGNQLFYYYLNQITRKSIKKSTLLLIMILNFIGACEQLRGLANSKSNIVQVHEIFNYVFSQ